MSQAFTKMIEENAANEAKWESNEANFPRKQMRRKNWMSLNGNWDFSFDDQESWNVPEDAINWDRQIRVPFAPESKLSGIEDAGFHKRCWYRRSFRCERGEKRILLHFGAVDYEAHVWLNGHFLGRHGGGHTPFTFEITDHLNGDGDQVLVVRADDDPHDLAKPRGKQDWRREPHGIWYPRTTGIWQTVWLEEVPQVYLDRIRWTPHLERWEIGCEAYIAGASQSGLQLKVRLSAGEELLANDTYEVINREVHRRIALSDPGIDDFRNQLLWSPEKPTLIDAMIELWQDGVCVDRVESYTALRSTAIQGDRFMLNGRPYYLRLILDQGYWRESLMTAPTPEHLRRDIELTKAAGFNGVRKHQKVEDPDFLYWADVLGLVVWSEMPSAYRFTHDSVERLTKEWIEVINRDANHPCVICWVPFNESWGVPDLAEKVAHQNFVQALYHLTRTLDPSRPVIGNDGWESTATDILGIHDYDDEPERILQKYALAPSLAESLQRRRPGGRLLTVKGYPHSGQPIMLTEFGGIACVSPDYAKTETMAWGYSVCRTPDELRRRYERLLVAVNQVDLFAGFCYTQLTDTFQEANGLFTMDRQPKFSLTAMSAATRGIGSRGELTTMPQPPPLDGTEESSYEQSGTV